MMHTKLPGILSLLSDSQSLAVLFRILGHCDLAFPIITMDFKPSRASIGANSVFCVPSEQARLAWYV